MNLNSRTFSRCQKRFENDTSYTFTLVDKNIHKCLSTVMVIFAALCDYYFFVRFSLQFTLEQYKYKLLPAEWNKYCF